MLGDLHATTIEHNPRLPEEPVVLTVYSSVRKAVTFPVPYIPTLQSQVRVLKRIFSHVKFQMTT